MPSRPQRYYGRVVLDHVFTDTIGALRDAFDGAFLERLPFEEHFQTDIVLGDLTWETSYGLPGESDPPDVVAHITFDWPSWSQTAYRQWYVEEALDRLPAIEIEIVFRLQSLAAPVDPAKVFIVAPEVSPLIGAGRLERAAHVGKHAGAIGIDRIESPRAHQRLDRLGVVADVGPGLLVAAGDHQHHEPHRRSPGL